MSKRKWDLSSLPEHCNVTLHRVSPSQQWVGNHTINLVVTSSIDLIPFDEDSHSPLLRQHWGEDSLAQQPLADVVVNVLGSYEYIYLLNRDKTRVRAIKSSYELEDTVSIVLEDDENIEWPGWLSSSPSHISHSMADSLRSYGYRILREAEKMQLCPSTKLRHNNHSTGVLLTSLRW